MGLAPQVVEEIFEIVKDLNEREGVSFLLAEQNTNIALRYARFGYILETGRVVLDGAAEALRANEDVREFYLGVAGDNRRSFKNVKTYKRRKRWLAFSARRRRQRTPSSAPASRASTGARSRWTPLTAETAALSVHS